MKPAISYIIASTQRSGTHLLCSILRTTGIAGSPDEFFLSKPGETWEKRRGAPSRDGYIERVLQDNTGANGGFGAVRDVELFRTNAPNATGTSGAQ